MFSTRPELSGTHGMVASTHWLASQSGMAVLEDGGNAFDAAVAAAFVLQVVEPHLNGPGGDLVLLFRTPDGDPTVLCGQGVAPAGATVDRYRSEGLDVVPGTGLLAAAVPGATPAWLTLLRDHGTLSVARVLRDAIGYAEHGHPVLDRVVDVIEGISETFSTYWPTSADVWLPAARRGRLLTNPRLASTYRRLAETADRAGAREAGCDAALRAWSQGFVAEAIEAFVRTPVRDSSGADHAGVLTAEDCAVWTPSYEPAATLDWRETTVAKPGSWSQGPVFLQSLALLDPVLDELGLDELGLDQSDERDPDDLGGGSAAAVHRIAETLKLALADRDAWFGDAEEDHSAVLAALLDPDYLDRRRATVGDRAATDPSPGNLRGRVPRLPRSAVASGGHQAGRRPPGAVGGGEPTLVREGEPDRGDTCHLDVADRWGNVISATPSGGWLQSSPAVPELGFCLGTRLQMTWLEPGFASTLTPGRRPRTTLSPSLVIADDGRVTAFGTPGGDQQDQWPLAFWLAHQLGGMNLQQAIDRPAFNVTSMISSFDPRTWNPAGLEIEARFPAAVIEELRDRGHRVRLAATWSLGRISAVSHDPSTGILRGAANARGMQGYAVGR